MMGVKKWGREVTPPSAPAEGDMAWSVSSLLHQRFVELAAGARVDAGPAVLTVVLQARDVGTEERGELASTARSLALVTHLIVQHVRLHLHLQMRDVTWDLHEAAESRLKRNRYVMWGICAHKCCFKKKRYFYMTFSSHPRFFPGSHFPHTARALHIQQIHESSRTLRFNLNVGIGVQLKIIIMIY